jgi:glyoxylase-like metal-dependent hydrolase (beta-lactamase superfamily II)
MPAYLCTTCSTQFPPGDEPPARCPICEDERQYVPESGQEWTTLDELRATHSAVIRDELDGLLGIGCEPSFAIGQRALLAGRILWDCQALLDDEIADAVDARGGLDAIAISHCHYYSTMVEWAHRFDCPVYVHADDREWVMRPDDAVVLWEGEELELAPGMTLLRLGGHFAGGQVLHWAERRLLLSGDIVQVIPDRSHVGFMYSYPNLIPLPVETVRRMAEKLEPWAFEQIVGAWWGRVVRRDAKEVVRRSAERYARAVDGSLMRKA